MSVGHLVHVLLTVYTTRRCTYGHTDSVFIRFSLFISCTVE